MGRPDTNAVFVLLLLLTLGCSATRSVRPVGEGRLGTALSVGGPLFVNLGPPLPAPIPVLSARYGISRRTDVDVGILLPVVPTLGLDAGASTLVLPPAGWRPAIMAGGRATLLGALPGLRSPHVLLEAHGTASWVAAHNLLAYTGADVLFDPSSIRLHPTALLGLSFAVPLGGLSLSAEARWLAMATSSRALSVRYGSLGGRGALGVVIALGYTFDLKGHHRDR
jgi:hypothetical protein